MSGWIVPVRKEPNHKQVFENDYVRLYIATLKPGQATMTHSHHVDTLYVVLQGGAIETLVDPADEGCSSKALKDYPIQYKLQLLWNKIWHRPMHLVSGFAFFMASGSRKVVHKAVASSNNQGDMVLLGIEIKGFELDK